MENKIDGDYILGKLPFNSDEWNSIELIDGLFLSHSPELSVVSLQKTGYSQAVIGLIYNPHKPAQSTREIAEQIAQARDAKEMSALLKIMAGCYVVLSFWKQEGVAFTDEASLRKIYYMERPYESGFLLSSSTSILANANNCLLKESLCFTENPSARVGSSGYLPGSLCSYLGIRHLTPHHYLSLPDNRPVRYYPDSNWQEKDYAKSLEKVAEIISGSAKSVLIRFPKIAIAMTSGYDSRTSLAAFAGCANSADQINSFTFKYPYLNENHVDIKTAQDVCKQIGINHKTLSVSVTGEAERIFAETFGKETPLVVSTIADIYRVFYRLPRISLKPKFMLKKERIPKNEDTLKALDEWFSYFEGKDKYMGYDVFDLFYLENRIARWGTKGFSGSGLQAIKVNIFNSRELLDIILQIDASKRRNGQFSRGLIELLYPKLTTIPFNPPRGIKGRVKQALNNVPGEKWVRYFKILLKNAI